MNNLKDKKTILKMFEFYRNYLGETTDEYKEMLKNFNLMKENFTNALIEEQKEELDKLFEYSGMITSEENKEYFIGGYSLATKLIVEGLKE